MLHATPGWRAGRTFFTRKDGRSRAATESIPLTTGAIYQLKTAHGKLLRPGSQGRFSGPSRRCAWRPGVGKMTFVLILR